MSKKEEIEFPEKLNLDEQKWLVSKPFGDFSLDESTRNFYDFATFLYLINRHLPKAQKIIELGCGPGWLSIFLSKMGFQCSGYDISPKMIEVAKKKAQKEGERVNFNTLDVEEDFADIESGQNDVALVYDALHHLQNEELFFKSAFRYLKNDGLLILAEPNKIHGSDEMSREATCRFGVTERGLDVNVLKSIAKKTGFKRCWRYHASGQSFMPRNETFADTLKMILFPILARFYFGKKKTRIWLVCEK